MEVTLDLAALVSALAWPAVIGFVVWRYREPLSEFLREAPRRVRSISAAGVSIELAETEPRALLSLQDVKVDLRRAGTSGDVNDSTLRSFYAQIEDSSRIDHAVVDLGYGSDWLSSRLFILSVILRRMRGLQAFVFVQSVENSRRHFLGVCDSRHLRWRLASRWPRYESGLAAAELHVWGHPYDDVSGLVIPLKQMPGGSRWRSPPSGSGPTSQTPRDESSRAIGRTRSRPPNCFGRFSTPSSGPPCRPLPLPSGRAFPPMQRLPNTP